MSTHHFHAFAMNIYFRCWNEQKLIWLYRTELKRDDVSFGKKNANCILMSTVVLVPILTFLVDKLGTHTWHTIVLERDAYGSPVESTGICNLLVNSGASGDNFRGMVNKGTRIIVAFVFMSYLSFSGFICSRIDRQGSKSSFDLARNLLFAMLNTVQMSATLFTLGRFKIAVLDIEYLIATINLAVCGYLTMLFLVFPSVRTVIRERMNKDDLEIKDTMSITAEGRQRSYGMVLIRWSRNDMISSLTDVFPIHQVHIRSSSHVKSDVSEQQPLDEEDDTVDVGDVEIDDELGNSPCLDNVSTYRRRKTTCEEKADLVEAGSVFCPFTAK